MPFRCAKSFPNRLMQFLFLFISFFFLEWIFLYQDFRLNFEYILFKENIIVFHGYSPQEFSFCEMHKIIISTKFMHSIHMNCFHNMRKVNDLVCGFSCNSVFQFEFHLTMLYTIQQYEYDISFCRFCLVSSIDYYLLLHLSQDLSARPKTYRWELIRFVENSSKIKLFFSFFERVFPKQK